MGKSLKKDREKIMQETRESRLILWELLRLRYPLRQLIHHPIAADEISEELKQALGDHSNGRRSTFKKWQRLRLWPPPEIRHDSEEQILDHKDDSAGQ